MVLFWGKGDDGIIVKGLSRDGCLWFVEKEKGRGALPLAWVLALWLLGPLPQSITLVLTMVMGEIIGFRCTLDSHLSSKFLPTFYLTLQNMIFFLSISSFFCSDQTVFWSILMSVLEVVTDCTSYYENLQVKVSYQSDKTFTLFTKGWSKRRN